MQLHTSARLARFVMALLVMGAAILSWTTYGMAQSLIYSAEMTSSAGWTMQELGTGGTFNTWGFDYSTLGIPEAPNTDPGDAATRGLQLKANVNVAFGGDQIAAVYEDPAFTGQYTLQVDAWLNWAADDDQVGTTEHGGVYVGFDTSDAAFDTPAQNGAGLLWSSDGGCLNCDYILTKDAAELDTFSGQYSAVDFGFGNQPGYDNTDGNADFDIPTIFPSFDIAAATNNQQGMGTQRAGAAGYQWVTITAEVDTNAIGNGTNGTPGIATFTIRNAASGDALLVGTVDNSVDDILDDDMDGDECSGGEDICTGEAPVGMDGGIGLMLVDFFTSNASNADWAFALYDNVRVYDGFLNNVTCDFNGDGNCDVADMDMLGAEVIAGTNDMAFDLTGDGMVDLADRDAFLAEAATENGFSEPYQLGDADLDGVTDGQDFIAWNANKFSAPSATNPWSEGDFTLDNAVDGQDFIAWNINKFNAISDAAVPEPATGSAWLLVMLGCVIRRRLRVCK